MPKSAVRRDVGLARAGHRIGALADQRRILLGEPEDRGRGGVDQLRHLGRGAAAERQALPTLARGAAMRFLATRAYDWLHTPADALVTRKDPMDFARRLTFYAEAGEKAFPL